MRSVPFPPSLRQYLVLSCRAVFAVPAAALLLSGQAFAQSLDDPPARAPASGLAILDCAPSPPAPAESCALRVPPGRERGSLGSTAVDPEDTGGSFELVQPGDPQFPADLTFSETLLLIDLTPGPGNGRAATFAREKALLRGFVEGLPRDEPLAIYGFNEELRQLSDFSTDRGAQLRAIDGLQLQGVNTLIATQARNAINILAGREDVLQKNLILVTDGEEEGTGTAADIGKAAMAADVAVSTMGMFWRRVGVPEIGRGKDFLEAIAEETLGAFQPVQLRVPDDAEAAVSRLAASIAESRRQSGLIMPRGDPGAAILSITLNEPVPGVEGRLRPRELRASFTPDKPRVEPAPPEEGWLFGLPWWAWVAIVFAVLLASGLIVFFLYRRGPEEEEQATPERTALPEDAAIRHPVAPPPQPEPKAWAYLVRQDTGERIPIRSPRAPIGRSRSNVVVLSDDSISRVHAELHRNRDGGASLTDMDSLNGTWLNDGRINGTRTIGAGDVIRFGDVRMQLVLP